MPMHKKFDSQNCGVLSQHIDSLKNTTHNKQISANISHQPTVKKLEQSQEHHSVLVYLILVSLITLTALGTKDFL